MKTVPRRLLQDSIAVEAYTGQGAYGPVYAASVNVLGKVSVVRQLVRNADGAEVVSELTLYVQPSDSAAFVPESRVTVSSHTSTVISAAPQNRPGEAVLVKVTCT